MMLINYNGVDLQFEWLINDLNGKDMAPNPSRRSQSLSLCAHVCACAWVCRWGFSTPM